jgi:hypothetical protein
MLDAIAAQDRQPTTYRVRQHWTILAEDFATLREAQRWRDKHERRYGGCLIAESNYPLTSKQG